jgi:Protein of unknown function, DUF481
VTIVPGARAVMRSIALAALLAASAPPAWAARTDVVVLRNGDRLTVEVVQLREGKLQVKTDDMGTLSIEWDKITAVTTAGEYNVTTRDGTRLLGRLRPGPAGSIEVVAADGGATAVPMVEMVFMARIRAKFLERIDGSLDLGGSYTQSSGVAQVAFDVQTQFRRPTSLYSASFATNFTRQPDSPDTSRSAADLRYTRFRGNRFASLLGLFERNEDLGFSFRGTGAAALGRYLARTAHSEWLLAGGLAVGRETPVDRPTVWNVDALITTDLSVFTYDFPTTRLDLSMLVFPSLDDPGRVRVNADGKFKRELFHDFYFSVSLYDAFDNRPKAETPTQNDFGGSLSFGWTF